MLQLHYREKDFLNAAFKAIREQEPFEVVVTGIYVHLLRFGKRLHWFQPFIMPSFWAIYTHASNKKMHATWSNTDDEVVVSLGGASSAKDKSEDAKL